VKSHGGEVRVGSVVGAAVLAGSDGGDVLWSVDVGDVTVVVGVGAAADGVDDVVGVAESDEPEPHAASPNSTTGRRSTRISYLLLLRLVVTIVRRTRLLRQRRRACLSGTARSHRSRVHPGRRSGAEASLGTTATVGDLIEAWFGEPATHARQMWRSATSAGEAHPIGVMTPADASSNVRRRHKGTERVGPVYEVRFKGRWCGPIAQALEDFETVYDGRDTAVAVLDPPAWVALVHRTSELGLTIGGVTRTEGATAEPLG
jgi:hypothetical protein